MSTESLLKSVHVISNFIKYLLGKKSMKYILYHVLSSFKLPLGLIQGVLLLEIQYRISSNLRYHYF